MMKHFEGRSLAHPGCLIGVTTGLIVGIALAGVLAASFNVPLDIDLYVWFGLTIALGIIGWFIGERLSKRFRFFAFQEETPTVHTEGAEEGNTGATTSEERVDESRLMVEGESKQKEIP